MNLRNAVFSAVVLTYIWRFHDLAPILSPLRLAALASAASWVMLFVAPGWERLTQALRLPYVVLVSAFFLWVGIATPWALNPDLAWETWFDGHLKTLGMFLFLLTCTATFASVRALMILNVIGAGVLTFYYAKGGFPLWGSPVPMYDVNDLALHLNITLPMVLFFAHTARDKRVRMGLWGLAGLMGVSVLMTQSRAGFLTAGVLVLYLILRSKSVWLKVVPAVGLVLVYFFLPDAAQERLSTLFNPTEDYNYTSEEGRIEIWTRGLGYLAEHPVFGVGVSNFPVAEATLGMGGNRVAHNSFLEVAAETGYPGFILYASAILLALWRIGRWRRKLARLRGSPEVRDMVLCADALTMSLLAFCVNGFFLAQAYAPVLMSALAMVAGFEIAAKRVSGLTLVRPRLFAQPRPQTPYYQPGSPT